jgi:hypothetical protein
MESGAPYEGSNAVMRLILPASSSPLGSQSNRHTACVKNDAMRRKWTSRRDYLPCSCASLLVVSVGLIGR